MSTLSFDQERLAAKKALLAEYDTALSAITTGQQESYRLDTGQSTVTVTNINLATLQRQQANLEAEIYNLIQRITGCGSNVARPIY